MFLNARAFGASRINIWEITQWYSYTSLSETRWNLKCKFLQILTEFVSIGAATLNLNNSVRGGGGFVGQPSACLQLRAYMGVRNFSIFLYLSLFLSYFLNLSQSFSLFHVHSPLFLNLSLLLSPFSIFLCLSAQDSFTHNLIFNSTVQSPLLLSQYFSICILQRHWWGLRVPKCVRISYMSTCWKNIFLS